ncbi:MAG: hypothetical protein O2874_01750 [Verrucomicrobia bacterium]|nr:hypothetical protein [Verrucomicrobiota bacterium]
MPTSLVWAQYVHPLDYPKVPQVDKIPSEYFLNLQLESPFQLLEQDADWIELKKEAFISEQDMKKIKLKDLNSYEDDFGIPEGFKTSKTSSVLQPNLVLNPSDKSSDPELDHNFALTNLIENSLKHIPTTQINNPIDPNLIDSSHQDELLEGIQTYPAHPKAFFHDSTVNQTENSRTTTGKPKDKHPTEILSYNEVLTSYPVYSGITSSTPSVYYNIFESDALEIFSSITPIVSDDENIFPNTLSSRGFSRQRRVNFDSNTAYLWEIRDFTPDSSNKGSRYDYFTLVDFNSSLGTFDLEIVPLQSGNIGTTTFGLDTNSTYYGKPANSSNSYNSYAGTSGFHFLNVSGTITGTPNFNINSDAISYYLGHWYGDWGFHQDGNDFYLTYSAVPEPSTYFMTGILFCFIGCNRSTRNTIKTFFSKIFMRWKTKDIAEDVQDRIS